MNSGLATNPSELPSLLDFLDSTKRSINSGTNVVWASWSVMRASARKEGMKLQTFESCTSISLEAIRFVALVVGERTSREFANTSSHIDVLSGLLR
jgi:hypothetical protein